MYVLSISSIAHSFYSCPLTINMSHQRLMNIYEMQIMKARAASTSGCTNSRMNINYPVSFHPLETNTKHFLCYSICQAAKCFIANRNTCWQWTRNFTWSVFSNSPNTPFHNCYIANNLFLPLCPPLSVKEEVTGHISSVGYHWWCILHAQSCHTSLNTFIYLFIY